MGDLPPMRDPIAYLLTLIRDVPDFPKPGIIFKDITPLLRDPKGLALSVEMLAHSFRGHRIDLVAGAESRGFIFGTALAQALSCGFIPVRKPGKLPARTQRITYDLEYGTDTLEIHKDAVAPGQRVLVVDDLLATGGTASACCSLVRQLGGEVVGLAVLIELSFLKARQKLAPTPVFSVIEMQGE